MDSLAQSILDRFGRMLDDVDQMNLSHERRQHAYKVAMHRFAVSCSLHGRPEWVRDQGVKAYHRRLITMGVL